MALLPLPLTYPDLFYQLDLDPFASETTSDLQNLTQDVLHLLLELPGSNPDDPDRGIGIYTYLSAKETDFRGLPAFIDGQLGRDDRITSSVTTIQFNETGTTAFTVNIKISVGAQVFPLSFNVTAAGVTPL